MTCTRCGKDLEDRAYCIHCGAARPETLRVGGGARGSRKPAAGPQVGDLFGEESLEKKPESPPARAAREPDRSRSEEPGPVLPSLFDDAEPTALSPAPAGAAREEDWSWSGSAEPAPPPIPPAAPVGAESPSRAAGREPEVRTRPPAIAPAASMSPGIAVPAPPKKAPPRIPEGKPVAADAAVEMDWSWSGSAEPAPPPPPIPPAAPVGAESPSRAAGREPEVRTRPPAIAPAASMSPGIAVPAPPKKAPPRIPEGKPVAAGAAVEIRMAGFWRRGLGSVVDLAILSGFCYLVLKIGVGGASFAKLPPSNLWGIDYLVELMLRHPAKFTPVALFCLCAAFGYFFVFQAVFAWTPGKRLLGMRIVDPAGRRIGPMRALLRTLGYGISVSFFMMGFLWAAFDLERRALHDVLCGTYVIVGQPATRGAPAAAPSRGGALAPRAAR